MGVVGSKRKYNSGDAKQGTGTDSRGQFDKNAPGGPDGDKKGEDAAKGEEAPPPPGELTAENIDEIKEKNFTKWSKIFSNISQLEQVKYKITALTKKQPSDNFVEKKIVFTEKDVLAYLSGEKQFALYLKEDIDKFWLMDESIKELMSDENKKGIIKASEVSDSDLKNFEKSGDKNLLTTVKDIITNIIKTIVPLFLEKTKIAVQHMALSEVIDYVLDTKEFKAAHKEANISGNKDAILAGDKTKEEVLMENREKKAEEKASAEEPKPKEGGDDYSISNSSMSINSSMSGGDDYSISNSSMSGGDDYSISNSSINSNMDGGGNEDGGEEGGGVFKTAEEKEYKKLKKEERGNFDEKKTDFLNDTFKRIQFIDTNQDNLLSIYSKSKVGVNVDKKSAGIETLIPILFEAINTYEKEPDTTGAAGVKSAAPPAAEGAEKDKAGAPPAAEGADAPPDKKDGGAVEPAPEVEPAGGAVEQAPVVEPAGGSVEPAPAVEPAPVIVQEGGGTIKPKQKRHTRKKPQRINININVGDKNVIDESSSSSSSSSDSSSSESEDEEAEVKPKIHIKHKKHTRRSRRI